MQGTLIYPEWTPIEVARHYGLPEGLSGAGQKIAVIDMGEVVDLAELAVDFEKLGLPMPDVQLIDLGGAAVPALGPSAIETHIDVEIIGSLCPGAQIFIYRCAFSFRAMADTIARAVVDGVDVISISWGAREDALASGDIARIENALQDAKQAGVTVCVASGDAGASGMTSPVTHAPIPDPAGGVHCIYPGSSPQVLSCGGTQIVEHEGVQREVVWNNTATGGRASGGGVSKQFHPPEWQKGMNIASQNRSGMPGRISPDVAAVAAVKSWKFFDRSGTQDLEGGTSAVAPLYASLIALANQQRVANGQKRLGFLNDRLYALAAKGGIFADICEGNNAVAPNGKGYEAAQGYDACTGWGIPLIAPLLKALVDLKETQNSTQL
ncbi:MAG: S53 family peptidase [Sulfitobacter sp.]